MRPTSPSRALRITGAVAAACLLAGCAVDPGLAEDSASDDGVPLPATEGYRPLTVHLAVAGKDQVVACAAVDEVEDGARQAPAREPAQVLDRRGSVKSSHESLCPRWRPPMPTTA